MENQTNPTPMRHQLRTNRGMLKYILLSLITLGIYGIVVMTKISMEIDEVATKYDNKSTMNYLLIYFIFSWLTLGIVPIVWMHRISNRIGNEQLRRTGNKDVSAGTFWGWNVLGSLIVVGPFIFLHKFFKAMNAVNNHYNYND